MKAIMISVNPPHAGNIADGIKTNEWRTNPLPIGKAYIYETKRGGGCGKVIGECEITENISFRLDYGGDLEAEQNQDIIRRGCVDTFFLSYYALEHNADVIYANLLQNAKRYDKPRKVGEFQRLKDKCPHKSIYDLCLADSTNPLCKDIICDRFRLTRPPQSWCYVEEN